MDTALLQKFPFILDRNLAKTNCTENHVCTSCDIVVLGPNHFYCYFKMYSVSLSTSNWRPCQELQTRHPLKNRGGGGTQLFSCPPPFYLNLPATWDLNSCLFYGILYLFVGCLEYNENLVIIYC